MTQSYRLTFNGRPTGQTFVAGRKVVLEYVLADGTEKTQPFPAGHPWARGLQHARMEALGYAVEAFTAPEPPQPPPAGVHVNLERDRRVAIAKPVTVAGRRFALDIANGGRDNITAVALEASRRIAAADDTAITFRDAANVDQELSPAEFLEAARQVYAAIDALYKASWALKDAAGGIPADYADDKHWP